MKPESEWEEWTKKIYQFIEQEKYISLKPEWEEDNISVSDTDDLVKITLRYVIKSLEFSKEIQEDVTFMKLNELGLVWCEEYVYLEWFKEHTLYKNLVNKNEFFWRLCKGLRF